jgi:hypothetical protein
MMMMMMLMIQVLANSSSSSVGFRRLISLHSPKCVNPISSSLPSPPTQMNQTNQTKQTSLKVMMMMLRKEGRKSSSRRLDSPGERSLQNSGTAILRASCSMKVRLRPQDSRKCNKALS